MAVADLRRASFGRVHGPARRFAATLFRAAGDAGPGADPRQHPLGPRPPQIRAGLAALSPLASFERRRGDRQELRRPPAGDRLAFRNVLHAEGQADLAAPIRHSWGPATEGNRAPVLLPVPAAPLSGS